MTLTQSPFGPSRNLMRFAVPLKLVAVLFLGGCIHHSDPLFKSTTLSYFPPRCAASPQQPPPLYRADPLFHGYYGTCWRLWPEGWEPCADACLWPIDSVVPVPLETELLPTPAESLPMAPLPEPELAPPHTGNSPVPPPGSEDAVSPETAPDNSRHQSRQRAPQQSLASYRNHASQSSRRLSASQPVDDLKKVDTRPLANLPPGYRLPSPDPNQGVD